VSVLIDKDILDAIRRGAIVVSPFDSSCLGTNSYDVHLASVLRVYDRRRNAPNQPTRDHHGDPVLAPLDVRERRATTDVSIPDGGLILQPGRLYLASTVERTESHEHVPMLNGRSSLGRLGLSIHVTAGTGDVGFCGHWTMEMFVIEPLRVYAGMPVGQLLWLTASGVPITPYGSKASAKYSEAGSLPQASKLHEELRNSSERR
jgi:dCTP deaminase